MAYPLTEFKIADMSAFLQEQPTAVTVYNEQLVRQLIERLLSTKIGSMSNLNPA